MRSEGDGELDLRVSKFKLQEKAVQHSEARRALHTWQQIKWVFPQVRKHKSTVSYHNCCTLALHHIARAGCLLTHSFAIASPSMNLAASVRLIIQPLSGFFLSRTRYCSLSPSVR